jgi:hypothetical protein
MSMNIPKWIARSPGNVFRPILRLSFAPSIKRFPSKFISMVYERVC